MRKILPFIAVLFLAGCTKTVYVKVSPSTMECAGIIAANEITAAQCSKDLIICREENRKWKVQCAARDAEIKAMENGK